jgi:Glycosyl hydrolases family 2, TIM barrel domain/Glycosyl hydrolases family 2, sugar binding domain/Glycosyl hydrolases family 2/Beta galactosidase small chain
MKKTILPFFFLLFFNYVSFAQQTILHYLSGTDKDHTIQWDFLCTKGRNSEKWGKIAVPSNWEFQGYGTFNYYQDKINPDETGFYKHRFMVEATWKSKRIFIVFDGSMTDTEVKINGQLAGPMHQGGFYQFKYDITGLLKYGVENDLEIKVSKHSANASINKAEREADFWEFGGIFRPVYLEIVPAVFIERVAIDARADGHFSMQVFTNATKSTQRIEARVEQLNGEIIEVPFSVKSNDSNILSHVFKAIKPWNPELPNLYNVFISIKEAGKIMHTVKVRFGFRTAELRPHDGFYVNGVKVIFKGVCRHSEWPESGRTLSRKIHLMDIGLMKEMNMNAVRMSHYPPDKEFLDLCDSLGLFVLDELTGWQKAYDTAVATRLVKELVIRDVNHPSIVIWDNGNEGGWNRAVDKDYALYDPQQRLVIHPWEKFNGTNTKHYPDFKYIQNEVANGKDVFFPTEFMHGLFDGGHGAGLNDFWNEMMKHPLSAGGFLWSLHDEGVTRADKKDSIDVAGNSAPDGIVGPHREKEGSFYTIKEIWSPISIETKVLPVSFDGNLPIANRYLYTNLDQCNFDWKLIQFAGVKEKNNLPHLVAKGRVEKLSIAPGDHGVIHLSLNKMVSNADALYLTAYDKKKKEIFTWSWAIHLPNQIAAKNSNTGAAVLTAISAKDEAGAFLLTCDDLIYSFNKNTGYLTEVQHDKKHISLHGGPALSGITSVLTAFKTYVEKDTYIVEPVYKQDSVLFTIKWIFQSGKLPQLNYQYKIPGETDYAGITFNYPEDKITGMKWLGLGPYRVWKNRLKGLQLGVWQKQYNNTITGESWNYPEFKGWHGDLYWVSIQNTESNFTVYSKDEHVFLQILQPLPPIGANNNNTNPPFPGNTLGFFSGISAIGTKFQPAKVLGPESGKNIPMNKPVEGTLLFDF